jgi:hypothetical protein
MTSDQKKAFLLLKSVIFHHQGQSEGESNVLKELALAMGAKEELSWVQQFILEDKFTAFERAREYLNKLALNWDTQTKLQQLNQVWEATKQKGFISEMEATAILRLAKDWHIQKELMALVRQKKEAE